MIKSNPENGNKLLKSDTNSAYSRAATAQRYPVCQVILWPMTEMLEINVEKTDSVRDIQQRPLIAGPQNIIEIPQPGEYPNAQFSNHGFRIRTTRLGHTLTDQTS